MSGQQHLSKEQVRRFLEGSLSRAEVRQVVRHLLSCPECRELSASLQELAHLSESCR